MFIRKKFDSIDILYLLMFMLLPICSPSASGFQGNYKININKETLHKSAVTKIDMPNLAKMPDLTISSLTFSNPQHSDKFLGTVKIKNIGKNPVSKPFYFSIQQLDNFNRWQRIPGACFKVSTPLKPDQTVSKGFVLKYNPGNRSVKIRAYADSACKNETPYVYRDIKESSENNNYSKPQTISGYFHPKVTGIYPSSAVIDRDTLHLFGTGFGEKQGSHGVYLKSFDNHYHSVTVIKWRDGAIEFKVPDSIDSGKYYVCADNACLISKLLELSKESFCSWNTFLGKIEGFYNLIGDINIDTRKPGTRCSYQNNSTEAVIGAHAKLKKQKLDVKNIQFHIKGLGDYRYTIHDLNADTQHITVVKSSGSQFIINMPFESRGVEAKGCFKSIAGGGWHDNLAPDIHINNLRLRIAIQLTQNNGTLNYKAATSVSANIKAAKKINTAILNLFVKHWRNRVKRGIINSMNSALNNNQETKNSIINSFLSIFYLYGTPKIPSGAPIKNIRFERDRIYLTY